MTRSWQPGRRTCRGRQETLWATIIRAGYHQDSCKERAGATHATSVTSNQLLGRCHSEHTKPRSPTIKDALFFCFVRKYV